jgi:predicted amidohydrolase YtcJ
MQHFWQLSKAAVLTGALVCGGVAWAAVPDLVYTNAKVVTVDPGNRIFEAVAIKGDRILAVGSAADIGKLVAGSTRVIDLGGKTVVPGFYDNHAHLSEPLQPWRYGSMIVRVPEWLVGVETLAQLEAAIRKQAAVIPKGGWIVGRLPREDWPNSGLPTRAMLDAAAPDHKVVLGRGSHTMMVNSRTLEAAAITRDTKPKGGEIVRDAAGEPTGKILEAAKRLVLDVMPAEPMENLVRGVKPPAEKMADWVTQMRQYVSLGITSGNVAGLRPDEFPMLETIYKQYGDELPRWTTQFRVWPGYDKFDDPEEAVRVTIAEIEAVDPKAVYTHPKLKMGAIKMSIDGGMSAPIFWSTRGYENRPDFKGEQRIPDTNLYRTAKRAVELGWQLGIHTMGDGAVVMTVNELQRILDELPKSDHRHYLHHVAVKPPEATLDKMVKYGIGVASQPGFLLSLGSYADEALEPEREETQNPAGSLAKRGLRVSFGSDEGPYGPLASIYAAVTRKSWNGSVKGLAEEGVSVADALRMHTLEGAYLTFDDKTHGSIEPGKFADLVVLSDDLMTVEPERIQDIRVVRTVIGGREVYNRPLQAAGL